MYKKAIAYIKIDKEDEPFTIGRGVEQVDPQSSNLSNSTLEKAFRHLGTGKDTEYVWMEKTLIT